MLSAIAGLGVLFSAVACALATRLGRASAQHTPPPQQISCQPKCSSKFRANQFDENFAAAETYPNCARFADTLNAVIHRYADNRYHMTARAFKRCMN